MRPVVKSIVSPDIDRPGLPPDPTDCSVPVEVEIGPTGERGAEVFSFVVVTPSKLIGVGPRWGRGLLVLDVFSWDSVDLALENLLAHCEGENWHEVAAQLNKELDWEFENYRG
jgi:hypothetical protein